MSNKALGAFGEERAVQHLESSGYKILERNWRIREGEIDIIADHKGEIVFVEVKTRISDMYGRPEDSITKGKRKRIIRASLDYLHQMEIVDSDWRVDLIAIVCTPKSEVLELEHYENVIEGPLEEFL